MRLLIVEDELRMADMLRAGLVEEGHSVAVANTGPQALDLAEMESFDVIVLDVMLPGLDGYAVAQRLRQAGDQTPILMLTARDTSTDIITGLDSGADDYLVKPFAFDVLLARLRAVSRRGPVERGVSLQVADVTLDPATREVHRSGIPLSLSRTEFSLLEFLMRRAGTVVPRRTLIEGVWGHEREIQDNTLDAFVRLLRQKVDIDDHPPLIHTVRGVGYVLREEPQP